jgi:uncharacterized OsmC-like protein
LTISAVAENKKINLDDLEVQIAKISRRNIQIEICFEIDIMIAGALTKREKILLFNSARKCDVGELLSGKFEFDYRLAAKEAKS